MDAWCGSSVQEADERRRANSGNAMIEDGCSFALSFYLGGLSSRGGCMVSTQSEERACHVESVQYVEQSEMV